MTPDELRQLVESNARTAQAMLDTIAEARLEREELREGMIKLQEAMVRFADTQRGIANLLASLDNDHPTILKKLTTIENKLDQVLEERNNS